MPENKNENQRPAWAQNMDEGQWEKSKNADSKIENNAETGTSPIENNSETDTSPKVSTNNIQEDNISASTNVSAAESKVPSLEELEAAIVKKSETKKAEPSEPKQSSPAKEHSDPKDTLEKPADLQGSSSPSSNPPSSNPDVEKNQAQNADKKISKVANLSSSSKFSYKPNTQADEAERPVRGYGILTFLPLLTLTILLTIHVISFIYSYSNKILVQNTVQVEVAKNLQLNGDLFIPTLQHITESAVSPAQLWYLSAFYKWLPFSDAINLHLAAAISALLLLCAVYLYSKAAVPGNKAVAFSAGLVLLSSTLFLAGAWFFNPIVLATALLFFSYYFVFKGLKHPTPALRYFIPGMILAALAVLAGGIVIAIAFIITLFVYLLISNQLKRLACKDLPIGLAVFAGILGLWLIGALVFRGVDGISAYLLPFSLTQGTCEVTWSLQHKLIFAGIFLLPWIVAPTLLVDQIVQKLSSLRSSLQTEDGQGTLFLICSLFAAAAVLAIDCLNHPMLLILSLPPVAVLAGRAVLYMKRPRARIFIFITALLFVALTGLIIAMATPWGKDILPWDLSIWTVAPLAGASIFCAVFMVRAAQVSAGKTMLLGFAICWLLMAQVFLFTGMPVALASLNIDPKLTSLPTTSPTPAPAPQNPVNPNDNATGNSTGNATGNSMGNSMGNAGELAENTPSSLAMPVFNATLPSTIPSMNATLPSTVPAFDNATNATNATDATNATSNSASNATVPADTTNQNDKNSHTQNATIENQGENSEEMPLKFVPFVNGTFFEQSEQPNVNATNPSLLPLPTPVESTTAANALQPPVQASSQATANVTAAPVLAEETIITTFSPKKVNKLNLVYGTIPAPPEFVISVRYRSVKQIEVN